jgi:hypothetical protein
VGATWTSETDTSVGSGARRSDGCESSVAGDVWKRAALRAACFDSYREPEILLSIAVALEGGKKTPFGHEFVLDKSYGAYEYI